MCGICLTISLNNNDFNFSKWLNDSGLEILLKNRGPDICGFKNVKIFENDFSLNLNFFASVLSMRGDHTVPQPIGNDVGDILLYNGEIYGGLNETECDASNDGLILFENLSKCSDNCEEMRHFVENLQGPRSFIYFNLKLKRLWINRDFFGRCSLLYAIDEENNCIIYSSVRPLNSTLKWMDIPTGCLLCIDLESCNVDLHTKYDTALFGHIFFSISRYNLTSNIILHTLNKDILLDPLESRHVITNSFVMDDKLNILCALHRSNVDSFLYQLRLSVKRRLNGAWNRLKQDDLNNGKSQARLAILFSGGVDSLLLTILIDEVWPKCEPIDLFNVAFEQCDKKGVKSYNVPDRITGINSLSELKSATTTESEKCRLWNFVEINVPTNELVEYRKSKIANLLYPCQTVLDDSIGCALWFTARGEGRVNGEIYSSTARAIVIGSGADELLAGYSRHRSKYQESGWLGLVEELEMELARLSIRNLSRDDRVLSDHGREPHAPYLDENFAAYCNSLPMNVKADLSLPRGLGEKLILRLALYSLGIKQAVCLPKRAMQFGSRIAKSENRKERGNDQCIRLVAE